MSQNTQAFILFIVLVSSWFIFLLRDAFHYNQLVFKEKSPESEDHHVGIEIEFFSRIIEGQLIEELKARKFDNFVQLQRDDSILAPEGFYAYELSLLGKEENIYRLVREVCKVLKKLKAQVNDSCGLHVHLDMRNRNATEAFDALIAFQNTLFKMIPSSRRDNEFCKRNGNESLDESIELTDRNLGINAFSYLERQTIEVRMHEGSINQREINDWVYLLVSIINLRQVPASSPPKGLKNLSSYLIKYINKRTKKFK
jgi:hypothetical protein